MTVFRISVVVQSTNRQSAVHSYEQLFASPPVREFQIQGRDLVVTAFEGFSILSGSAEALSPARDLRATVFVSSLEEIEDLLVKTGWTREGALDPAHSMLARDSDGNLLEFVEKPADEPKSTEPAKEIQPDRV